MEHKQDWGFILISEILYSKMGFQIRISCSNNFNFASENDIYLSKDTQTNSGIILQAFP